MSVCRSDAGLDAALAAAAAAAAAAAGGARQRCLLCT